ncbi:segregation/condensation protein A [bacterium]|nr:segregation/condensation protein A [bacterium]
MFERDHKRRELAYQVKLEHFEGPMDLLLHLIRRDKINIYDIPIAHITREYLSYIEIMKELELEVAGEFFVMAATLMRIKVQMLLPRRVVEEEEEDPREELVRNLIEYKKFKKAADHLAGKESSRRDVFVRPVPEYIEEKNTIPKMELSLFDLMDAFKTILKDLRKKITYRVEIESHSVDEKIDFIKERINNNSEILFTELIKEADSKIEIIAIFLAILELIRGGFIIARQMLGGNDIWIYRREDIKVVERQEY